VQGPFWRRSTAFGSLADENRPPQKLEIHSQPDMTADLGPTTRYRVLGWGRNRITDPFRSNSTGDKNLPYENATTNR